MSTEALCDKKTATETQQQCDSVDLDGSASDNCDDEFFDPEEESFTFDKSFDSKSGNNIERLLMRQSAGTSPMHNRLGARCPVPDGMPLTESGDQVSLTS